MLDENFIKSFKNNKINKAAYSLPQVKGFFYCFINIRETCTVAKSKGNILFYSLRYYSERNLY